MSTAPRPQGKAMYVASQSDKDWLLDAQRKLYTRSQENPAYVFRKLWGVLTDSRNLRVAFARVAGNRGRRTAGVDGFTVGRVLTHRGVETFVGEVRAELRSGAFVPSPVRRVLIPKPGQPGTFRPLGIPTVKDRVVQAALKNILEPIFEADFYPSSFGFRPGRGAHAALEELRLLLFPARGTDKGKTDEIQLPYQWAIEGDIKGCFDNIGHHGLMQRIRRRIDDTKVNRLVLAFLKAGVMTRDQLLRTTTGTPQGGILSPLLANIALSVIDERYERWVWPRHSPTPLRDGRKIQKRANSSRYGDRQRRNRLVFVPVRYADDFIVLVGAPPGPDQQSRAREAAITEKAALACVLKETLGLELSEEKTVITPVTRPMRFLGHHVRVQYDPIYGWCSKAVVPKDRSKKLRALVQKHFSADTTWSPLRKRLDLLNPILRGWSSYYRHAWGAKRVFGALDRHVWFAIRRWLRAKHGKANSRCLHERYGWRKPGGRMWRWRDDGASAFETASQRVCRYRHAWMTPPNFVATSMESPVHSERCTPGSEGGARKPAGESR